MRCEPFKLHSVWWLLRTPVLSETAKNDVRKRTKWKICNRNKSNARERPQDGAICLVNLVGMTMKTSLPFTYDQSLAYTQRCLLHSKPALIVIQCVRDRQPTKQNTDKELKRSYTTDWSKVKPEHCTRLTVWNGLEIINMRLKCRLSSFNSKSWMNVQELLLFVDICAPYSQDKWLAGRRFVTRDGQ